MPEELKPCPWCNQKPEVYALEEYGNYWWFLRCNTVGCFVQPNIDDGYPTEKAITVAWNTRVKEGDD